MFDPYHKWLGIPPGKRPPTYYQLLGLTESEKDREVIETAAVRQSVYVRNFQNGQYADAATKLLTEIAEARLTLTDADKRRSYDAKLAAERPRPVAPAARPKPAVAVAVAVAPNPPPSEEKPRRPKAKKSGNGAAIVAAIAVCCTLGAVAGVAYVAWPKGDGNKVASADGASKTNGSDKRSVPDNGAKTPPNVSQEPPPVPPIAQQAPLDAPPNPMNNGLGPQPGNPPIPNFVPPGFGGPKGGKFGPFGPGKGFGPGNIGPGGLPPIPEGSSGSMTTTTTGPDGNTKTTTITFGPKKGAGDEPAALTDLSKLRRGQKVEAKRGEAWVNATIKDLRLDKVLVEFEGFAASFNEWVGPERVRLPGGDAMAGGGKKGGAKRGAPSNIDDAIALLHDGGHFALVDACKALAVMEVDSARQGEVVDALCDVIGGNKHAPGEVFTALAKWKNKKAVGVIAMKLTERPWTSSEAIKAAAMMKDKELVLPLVELLTNFFQWDEASSALKQMGPVAETQVLVLLNHRDPKMRAEACRILAQIGTAKSIPRLRKALTDKNTKTEASAALTSVNARVDDEKLSDDKSGGKDDKGE